MLFGIGSYTFFCLVLVLAVCKKIGFSPSVSSNVKKIKKLTECHVPQLFHATWHPTRKTIEIKKKSDKIIVFKLVFTNPLLHNTLLSIRCADRTTAKLNPLFFFLVSFHSFSIPSHLAAITTVIREGDSVRQDFVR